MKKALGLLLSLILCLSLCACGEDASENKPLPPDEVIPQEETSSSASVDTSLMELSFTDRELKGEYSSAGDALVTLDGNSADISGKGAEWQNGRLLISAAGTYLLSGNSRSYIEVAAGENDKVQLVLNGLEIDNQNGPAIFIKSADKVFITLKEGTENKLYDGEEYTFSDDDGLDGAVFSRADLCINGNGTLTVEGRQKHGIVSKDDLVLAGGKISVTAAGVALDGKDCVKITKTELSVTAGTDGIRASNTEDVGRGYIYIKDGTISIVSGNDAVQAETALLIENGEISAVSGDGSANASYNDGGWNKDWMMPFGGTQSETDTESAKGLKSSGIIEISGGSFTLDTADDCVHSNGNINISGGSFTLSSGDDGIHADNALEVSDGNIEILKSYEGIEATDITLSGGKTNITASDDGLNAAGGNDGSSMGGRPGMGAFSGENGSILISGGIHKIDASGDGVDSNGTLTVTGGETYVCGPTNSGNGALDYGAEATVTGGTFIATGSSGMATGFTSAENQGAILCNFGGYQGGAEIKLLNSKGKALLTFTPSKAFSSVVISTAGIEKNETYTITVAGETVAEITMDSLVYGFGGMGDPSGMGGHGGMGAPGGHGGFGKK